MEVPKRRTRCKVERTNLLVGLCFCCDAAHAHHRQLVDLSIRQFALNEALLQAGLHVIQLNCCMAKQMHHTNKYEQVSGALQPICNAAHGMLVLQSPLQS